MIRRLAAIVILLTVLSCAGQNRNEREADRITRAVLNDDLSPIIGDFDPSIEKKLTRIQIAQAADELNNQGAYQGLKEDDSGCDPGFVCFDVAFTQRSYREKMQIGSDGKVRYWWYYARKRS